MLVPTLSLRYAFHAYHSGYWNTKATTKSDGMLVISSINTNIQNFIVHMGNTSFAVYCRIEANPKP